MTYKYNPFTDKLDRVKTEAEIHNEIADDYVNVPGDTMTGILNIAIPSPSTEGTALTINKNVILKAGAKLIFDGDY